jgi:hypothetical protein
VLELSDLRFALRMWARHRGWASTIMWSPSSTSGSANQKCRPSDGAGIRRVSHRPTPDGPVPWTDGHAQSRELMFRSERRDK